MERPPPSPRHNEKTPHSYFVPIRPEDVSPYQVHDKIEWNPNSIPSGKDLLINVLEVNKSLRFMRIVEQVVIVPIHQIEKENFEINSVGKNGELLGSKKSSPQCEMEYNSVQYVNGKYYLRVNFSSLLHKTEETSQFSKKGINRRYAEMANSEFQSALIKLLHEDFRRNVIRYAFGVSATMISVVTSNKFLDGISIFLNSNSRVVSNNQLNPLLAWVFAETVAGFMLKDDFDSLRLLLAHFVVPYLDLLLSNKQYIKETDKLGQGTSKNALIS